MSRGKATGERTARGFNLRKAGLCALIMAGCGGEEAMHPEPMLLTQDNARSVTSALWLGHAVTEREDLVSPQVWELLNEYFPLLAYRPNELALEIGCRESGLVRVSGHAEDGEKAGQREGDQATAVFEACEASYGSPVPETTSGTLSAEAMAPNSNARVLLVRFDELSIEIPDSGAFTQNGELTFTESVDTSTNTLESERLTVSGGGVTRLLTDYSLRFRAPREGEYLLEFNGTQSGGEFPGALTFETTVPFRGRGHDYPKAGRLEIVGAESSRVTLEAMPDGESVVLTINGTNTLETTWIELEE